MAFDIGKLFGRIDLEDNFSGAVELIGYKLDKLDSKMGGFGKHVAETAAGFLTAQAAAAAMSAGLKLAVDVVTDLAMRGSEVASVSDNFEHLTAQAGRLSETLLGELREGTQGTIDDLQLMKLANSDLAAGMNLTDQQFRTMADGAFSLAQATGVSVADALEKMNDAMLTGRTRGIQMLTGKIDLTAAEEKFAASLGTTRDRLTEEGKLEAARLAILQSVEQATARLGEQTAGLGEMVAQAQTMWRNFQDDLGESIATSPLIIEGFRAIGEELVAAFGGDKQEMVKTITRLIEDVALSSIEVAKVISDGIGIAGMTWNSFKLILTEVVQGYRAITIAVEEVALAAAKVGAALGSDAAQAAVEALEQDLDRLYTQLAKTAEAQDGYKRAQDEWAQGTGKVNEALDRIKQRMLDARESQDEAEASLKVLGNTQEDVTTTTNGLGSAQSNTNLVMAQTAEEAKKQAAAMAEIASAGKNYKDTIANINAETVKAVKGYLEAGVAQGTLATAYKLTQTEMSAIAKEYGLEAEALKKSTEAAKEKALAMAELKAQAEPWWKTLQGTSQKLIQQATDFLKVGASASTVAKALGLTDAQMIALQKSIDETKKSNDELSGSLRDNLGGSLDEASKKVKTLSGELITLEEHQARQSSGGSFEINRGNLAQNLKTWGVPEQVGIELAKKGLSFQEIIAAWQSQTYRDWKPQGPKIPGFREGGIGNFGDGTLAMLHGREAIIPLNRTGGAGLGNVNNFYVNGTAEDVAHKISNIIMRKAQLGRQFGSA